MSSNTKRNNPYVKKENKKKTEAKNKLKGSIVIDALPMNDPDFRGKDNVPDTPIHDNFGGEPPKFDVNEPGMAVDYMKPEHNIPPKACQVTAAIERVEQTGRNYQDRSDDREDRGRSARRRRDSTGFWYRYVSVFLLG